MILFLLVAGLIWGIGWQMKTPLQARWILIGLLYLLIVGVLVILPEGAPLRTTLGGSAGNWLAVGALVGLGFAYSMGLRKLRGLVRPENRVPDAADAPPAPDGPLTDTELDRYARHIVLREVGGTGQRALKRAGVLVIGAGGLGAPVLQYLAGAGVGLIGVIDDDLVSASNLHRQVIHRDADVGRAKVFSAKDAMLALNPLVAVRTYNRRLTPDIATELVAEYDLVIDGSDNFDTRYMVNAACVAAGVPLVAGAIAQWEGQVSVYDPAHGAPCFACVFPTAPAAGLAPACAEAGVIGPLPGIVGAMLAAEAVKLITDAGTPLRGQLVIHDALEGESRRIAISRRPDCAVCGGTD
jgi:molybdopterin/thiamine biosynthesis adenylyltransferase